MKSPREWAEEVVEAEGLGDEGLWAGSLGDVRFEPMYSADVARSDVKSARAFIERLVERVQADALASCRCRSPRLLNLLGTTVGVQVAADDAPARRSSRGARRRR